MQARIETIPEKKLIGNRLRMTLADNKTGELWRRFMPKRKEIKNVMTTDLISMQVYDKSLDSNDFNAETGFEKWAVVEVSDFDTVPDTMETYTLIGGLYAVFLYQGDSRFFQETFQYIFGTWLPNSAYELDRREHFEILGENYKNNDPASEEEIWIPIKHRTT